MPEKKKSCHGCSMQNLQPTKARCPECGNGLFEPARGRFGPIWRCTNKPDCKQMYLSRPLGKACIYKSQAKPCGAMMVEGTKTIPDRCSNRECPNRNPHKL